MTFWLNHSLMLYIFNSPLMPHIQGRKKQPSFCPYRERVLVVLTDNVEMWEPQPHPVRKNFSASHLLFILLSFTTFFFSKIGSPVAEDVLKFPMSLKNKFQPLISLPSHSKSWDYKCIQPSLASTVIRIQTKALQIRQAPYQLSLFQATVQTFFYNPG